MLSFWHILVSILLISIVWFGLKVRSSSKKKQAFVKHAKYLGYQVYEYPFKLFGFTMYTEYKRQQKMHGDAYHHYKHELSKYDLIVSNLLFTTMVEILNPEIIKQFYIKSNEGHYKKGDFVVGHSRALLGNENLFVSNGQQWKQRRKLLSSVFNYDFIISQINKIQEICEKALNKMQQNYSDSENKNKIRLNITQPINEVFSNSILKCFFKGDQLNQVGQQKAVDFINKLLTDILRASRTKLGVLFGRTIARFGLTSESRRINREIKKFRDISTKIVQNRIAQIEKQKLKGINGQQDSKASDIIDAILKASEKNQKDSLICKQFSSSESIINQFIIFFLSGTQTTITFTKMMIYLLASNPQVMQKVREQIKRQIKSQKICLQELKKLKYFEKVQKQVLRMYPSLGAIITRLALSDHYLGGLKIRKGMAVNVRIRGVHYKQSEYLCPLKFNPDRWDDQSSMHKYAYLPFSSGTRNCIGQHLALLENKILMIKFLNRYQTVQISKQFGKIKMVLGSMYGPQPIQTILQKVKSGA